MCLQHSIISKILLRWTLQIDQHFKKESLNRSESKKDAEYQLMCIKLPSKRGGKVNKQLPALHVNKSQ